MDDNIYFNWDEFNDYDLDDHLGEGNWTEDELLESDSNNLTSSSDSNDENPVTEVSVGKENKRPKLSTTTTSSAAKPTPTRKYKCPMCEKLYASVSGFRAHVTRKHDRPDLKAHMHKTASSDEVIKLPDRTIPMSTAESFKEEIQDIVIKALRGISSDKFHNRPSSKFGSTLINVSQQLLQADLLTLHSLLFTSFSQFFESDTNLTPLAVTQHIKYLRNNPEFIDGMLDIILGNVDFALELKVAKMILQQFLTNFTTNFIRRQTELLNVQQQIDFSAVTTNDKQVIHYICGFILHKLNQRYWKAKAKHSKMLELIGHLYATDTHTESDYHEWTEAMDRGGLKKPGHTFVKIMVQVECWVRDIVDANNLNTNSLVDLKDKVSDSALLRSAWDNMIKDDDSKKCLLLDHVLALFFKVRGFAVTKLVRKQLQKKRKDAKIKAGTRKALRKELRDLPQN